MTKHFDEWTKKGIDLGLMYETSLTIKGFQRQRSTIVNRNDNLYINCIPYLNLFILLIDINIK